MNEPSRKRKLRLAQKPPKRLHAYVFIVVDSLNEKNKLTACLRFVVILSLRIYRYIFTLIAKRFSHFLAVGRRSRSVFVANATHAEKKILVRKQVFFFPASSTYKFIRDRSVIHNYYLFFYLFIFIFISSWFTWFHCSRRMDKMNCVVVDAFSLRWEFPDEIRLLIIHYIVFNKQRHPTAVAAIHSESFHISLLLFS